MTPRNPEVLKIQAQISEVTDTIAKQRANVLNGIANGFHTARARGNASDGLRGTDSNRSGQLAKAVHYNTLKREVETIRALYEVMLRRVSDAEVVSAIHASDLLVAIGASAFEPAFAEYAPDSRHRTVERYVHRHHRRLCR